MGSLVIVWKRINQNSLAYNFKVGSYEIKLKNNMGSYSTIG